MPNAFETNVYPMSLGVSPADWMAARETRVAASRADSLILPKRFEAAPTTQDSRMLPLRRCRWGGGLTLRGSASHYGSVRVADSTRGRKRANARSAAVGSDVLNRSRPFWLIVTSGSEPAISMTRASTTRTPSRSRAERTRDRSRRLGGSGIASNPPPFEQSRRVRYMARLSQTAAAI